MCLDIREVDDNVVCQGEDCKKESTRIRPINYHEWARVDHYGLYTGIYCDDCYDNNYPYRKDDYYDPAYAGESMYPEEEDF